MGGNYQLINPVLLIVSVGLIAYLIYLLSLTIMGSPLRMAENVILILVIIAAVLMVAIMIRQGTKLQERLERVLRRKNQPSRTVVLQELPHHILNELDDIIMGGKKEEEPKKEKPGVKKEPVKEREKKPEVKEETTGKEKEPEEKSKIETKPPEEMPKTVSEKLEEISRLLKEGAKLKDTDIAGAKKAFLRVKDIYNSLSPDERKLIDRQITKAMSSHKKTAEKPAKEMK